MAVLAEIWLRGSPGEKHAGLLGKAFVQLGISKPVDQKSEPSTEDATLADIVILTGRSGRIDGPRHLICPTLLGVGSLQTPDIRARIDRFLGLPAVLMQTHDSAAEAEFA